MSFVLFNAPCWTLKFWIAGGEAKLVAGAQLEDVLLTTSGDPPTRTGAAVDTETATKAKSAIRNVFIQEIVKVNCHGVWVTTCCQTTVLFETTVCVQPQIGIVWLFGAGTVIEPALVDAKRLVETTTPKAVFVSKLNFV